MTDAFTVIVTPADIVAAPLLSVAFAVRMYVPVTTLDHTHRYGAAIATPRFVGPLKNSTLAIVPSMSEAVASIAMLVGVVNAAPFVGLIIATLGASFTAVTVIETVAGAESTVPSLTLNVNESAPL